MKNQITLSHYQSAIEFIEYIGIFLESGHHIHDSFLFATIQCRSGDVKNECLNVLRLFDLGYSLSDSLERCSHLTNLKIIREIFEILHVALRLGTQIIDITQELSHQLRIQSIACLEKMGYEAPVKMIFPLVIFIFPVLFTLFGTKTLLNFIQSLGV